MTGRGAAATRPPWWRFWPGSEKPHQSPDGPAAANNGMTKPKLKTSEQKIVVKMSSPSL